MQHGSSSQHAAAAAAAAAPGSAGVDYTADFDESLLSDEGFQQEQAALYAEAQQRRQQQQGASKQHTPAPLDRDLDFQMRRHNLGHGTSKRSLSIFKVS